jgi:hypothetical protein
LKVGGEDAGTIPEAIEQSNTIDKGVHNVKEKKFDFIQIDSFKA